MWQGHLLEKIQYISFILQIDKVQYKYASSELAKRKYKLSTKTTKNKYLVYTSFIILDFCLNKVYFKYTSEFENDI